MNIPRRTFLQLSSAVVIAGAVPPMHGDDSKLCRKLASDPLRPQYHLLPDHNWMNDPNGPIFYGGRYHMFHQYNPQAAVWGNMNWAHATSDDMIHWHHEPIALAPTPGGPDQDGVFSGSAVLDHGKPTIIYTGVQPPHSEAEATLRDGVHTWRETQCLAVAADKDLRNWQKMPESVISAPPAGLQVTGFRDPCLWREGDLWMLILGSGIRNHGGTILLYSSPDLRHWTYLHPLVQGPFSGKQSTNPVDTGDMWECPDFFALGSKHVLLISTMGKVHWKVGTYADRRFTTEKEGIVDWGSYYAAKTMLDRDGNRVLWGWIPETRPDADLIKAGWAGVMSLPRMLSLSSENELQMDVAPVARVLRGKHTRAEGKAIEDVRIENLAAEFELQIPSDREPFTIRFQSNNAEFVKISCTNDSRARRLSVDEIVAALPEPSDSPLRLHMFLDGSVLEIQANRTTAVTARVYRVPDGPLRVRMEGLSERAILSCWQMTPISRNRLTGPLCR